MPCVFCGRPFNSPGAFCYECLKLLVIQRAIAQGRVVGNNFAHLRPVVKPKVCRVCKCAACACTCDICSLGHTECACSAQAILEHYGVFGGETTPPTALDTEAIC